MTQGVENVEVAVGKTATAPDILLTRGARVRMQLIDDETGEPMRFDKPTRGHLTPRQQPRRADLFFIKNTVIEFSVEGIGEIQVPEGQYSILAVIPISKGVSRISSEMLDDRDKWPTYQVKEGELLEISTRLRIWKSPKTRLENPRTSKSSTSDEESDDDSAETAFVPETPPAETEDQ